MANTSKVIDLDRLARFKAKQDAANDAKFALKGEGGSIATADKAGIVKPGGDFDITEDGTISLYKAMGINSLTVSPSQAERGSTVADVTVAWSLSKTPKSTPCSPKGPRPWRKHTSPSTASHGRSRTCCNAPTRAPCSRPPTPSARSSKPPPTSTPTQSAAHGHASPTPSAEAASGNAPHKRQENT